MHFINTISALIIQGPKPNPLDYSTYDAILLNKQNKYVKN